MCIRDSSLATSDLHRTGLQEGERVFMLKAGAGQVQGRQPDRLGTGMVCATHQLKSVGAPAHTFGETADNRPGNRGARHVLTNCESSARRRSLHWCEVEVL